MANLSNTFFSADFYPQNYPVYMNGKLTYKVKLKKDYVRADGTCAVYIQVFLNGKKMFPLNISVATIDFDDKKQRVKNSNKFCNDYNLIIEKKLADINTIEVNYRLANRTLSIGNLTEELSNPSARMDFVKFWTDEMVRQKDILKPGTYKQQVSVLQKMKKYKNQIFFYEITDRFLQDFKIYCSKKLKNTPSTIGATIKSFKKYLHLANKKGIVSPLNYSEIKNKNFKGNRTFLMPEEIKQIFKYWESEFINDTHKNILSRFLFSCFTGLRFSDIESLKPENFVNDILVFTAEKTGKFQRIPLNKTAKKFVCMKNIFLGNYTGQYINRELKLIAAFLKINKNISFHVSRHSFATNFLLCDGRVEHLQKILGHSKIEETMIYVHIVEQITNDQILNMDEIIL